MRPQAGSGAKFGYLHWLAPTRGGLRGGHKSVVKVSAEWSLWFFVIFHNVLCSILMAPGPLWWSPVVKNWPVFRGQFLTTKVGGQGVSRNRGHAPSRPTHQAAAGTRDRVSGTARDSARRTIGGQGLRAAKVHIVGQNLTLIFLAFSRVNRFWASGGLVCVRTVKSLATTPCPRGLLRLFRTFQAAFLY